jgi:hypothetical protein
MIMRGKFKISRWFALAHQTKIINYEIFSGAYADFRRIRRDPRQDRRRSSATF